MGTLLFKVIPKYYLAPIFLGYGKSEGNKLYFVVILIQLVFWMRIQKKEKDLLNKYLN
jgi:hypothetical protein